MERVIGLVLAILFLLAFLVTALLFAVALDYRNLALEADLPAVGRMIGSQAIDLATYLACGVLALLVRRHRPAGLPLALALGLLLFPMAGFAAGALAFRLEYAANPLMLVPKILLLVGALPLLFVSLKSRALARERDRKALGI